MKKYFYHRIFSDRPGRNSVGGDCILPAEVGMPCCRLCGKEMVLFFQFDLPDFMSAVFKQGSHLSVLMCPEHNEIPSFESYTELPADYWKLGDGHWQAFLALPGCERTVAPSTYYLKPAELVLSEKPDESYWQFTVGGHPDWIQGEEKFTCSCGAPMEYICQIGDGHELPKLEEAPEQPDSSSSDGYVLFLGNEVYIFACKDQCDPRAVWATVQN